MVYNIIYIKEIVSKRERKKPRQPFLGFRPLRIIPVSLGPTTSRWWLLHPGPFGFLPEPGQKALPEVERGREKVWCNTFLRCSLLRDKVILQKWENNSFGYFWKNVIQNRKKIAELAQPYAGRQPKWIRVSLKLNQLHLRNASWNYQNVEPKMNQNWSKHPKMWTFLLRKKLNGTCACGSHRLLTLFNDLAQSKEIYDIQ